MAKEEQEKEDRLVAVSAVNIGGTSYQKGELVTGIDSEERDYYVEAGVLWTEAQWTGKYKTEPVEHKEPPGFPPREAPHTTAQAAAVTQTVQPELRREGDTRIETTTSGQNPTQRKVGATPPDGQKTTGTSGTDTSSKGPAADARQQNPQTKK